MTTPRHHRRAPKLAFTPLEPRTLLSGDLSAVWIGQDLHDLVGPSSVVAPDGVQDIHITLTNLPANRTIAWAKIEALGGGEWQYQGPWGPWAAQVVRENRSTTAEVFADPYQTETGRPFSISLIYDDGSTGRADFAGGVADPNLRMPSDSARLIWNGQDTQDLVGPGPSVGPDRIQDLHLTLENLSATVPITSVSVSSSGGAKWATGTNSQGLSNAELVARGTSADLFLNPQGNPQGQTLTATIFYANGKQDSATVTAGFADPSLSQPLPGEPIPTFRQGVSASWIGQDGQNLAGLGSARLGVSGLPAGRTIVAASLSDSQRGLWLYQPGASSFPADSWAGPLAVRMNGNKADVAFLPVRDEANQPLTLRLGLDDGSQALVTLTAGPTDPSRRVAAPASSSVVAHPGDDLNALANAYGTVRLSAGVYEMSKPLVLLHPVAIVADPGVTLRFSQGTNDPAWTTAIKIHSGNTTLDGFAVRFASSIRWADNVSYGAAVIGTTDNLDTISGTIKTGLRIANLDIESPPVSGQTVESPRLMRLVSGGDGQIVNNRLKGGTTEFRGGPWTISGNTYLGTVPNTFSWTAFAGHETHDLLLSGNTASPQGPSGKTWRFLVLTGTGNSDQIVNNTVVGIGPRDTDSVDMNAAELILTESYQVKFEGAPSSISSDGLVLQITKPQGEMPRTGDMVAILSGSQSGQYRRIVQALGAQTFLLDSPMPSGSYAISIASGFVSETFQGNTIDARGGSAAGDLILVGNHYGTSVIGNHFLGGNQAFKISSSATESPVSWGWTHSPFLGATITDNVLEDSFHGGTVSVEHGPAIKSTTGRTYFSGELSRNSVVWTSGFLNATGGTSGLDGLIVGEPGSLDPGELVVKIVGNRATVPAGFDSPTLRIAAALVNGVSVRDTTQSLGGISVRGVVAAPTGLSLVNDTGLSAADRITTDGRIRFDPVPGAESYEYLISGSSTTYTPVPSPSGFLPVGLTQVQNTLLVRAIDALGNRSADAMYQFFLDNLAPITSGAFLNPSNDTGPSVVDRVTRVTTPEFGVNGDPTDTMVLVRDGVDVASRLGPGSLRDASPRPDGVVGYAIRRIDAAGNASISPTTFLTIDATPPPGVSGLRTTTDGQATFVSTGPDDRYEYRFATDGGFVSIGRRTSFAIGGASRVGVRAIDLAGNIGPETWITIQAETVGPTGEWLGQDGKDFVGPTALVRRDGRQDIHIRLSGLPTDQRITFASVQGLGGSEWQYGGARGPWRAYLVQKPGSSTADLYLQPDQVETGRPFSVTLRYEDGSTASFWVEGGSANPARRAPRGNRSVPSGPLGRTDRVASRRAARKAALRAARIERIRQRQVAALQADPAPRS